MENNKKPDAENLLQVCDIYKSFGDNAVLKGMTLSLASGEVLSLIGGNGAGKSTLMKIIMGIYTHDSGKVIVNGKEMTAGKTTEALSSGVYMVPQEPLLFPNMTVEENILIGFTKPQSELHKELVDTMKKIGWNLELNRKANTLSIAEQQLVELLRGLLRHAKILILDEPTSALTFKEVESLFKVVKDLKAQGIGIIYITHRLDEVFEISTDVGIMRDGRITLMGKIEEFTKAALVKGLLPDATDQQEIVNKNTVDYSKDPVLELKNYSGYGFKDISLKVYPGEILGVAGVVGAFLGSIIGVICIIIIGELGYVAAISGVVMAICVLKGYEVLGGKASKKGIVISVIIMLVMTWVGDRLDWAIIIYKELSQYADVNITIFDCYRMIPDMLSEGYMDMSNYITNLVMIYAFLLLGMIPTVKGFINDKKNENRMIRIGGANSTVTTETNSENIE